MADTTQRHEQAEIRASEERYRLLFETSQDAIVLVDAETLRLLDAKRAGGGRIESMLAAAG
ncbi:MAG: PAS domain S-box protein [Acidimicrobiia bacterium]